MTKCEILKDFSGSQNGTVTTEFKAGETADISDYLMGCINPSWVKVIGKVESESDEPESEKAAPEVKNKAVITPGNKGGSTK